MLRSVFIIFAALSSCFVNHVLPGACIPWNAAPPRSCPPKWYKWRSTCYLVTESTVEWTSARDECRKLGGVLAVPRSLEENSVIVALIPDKRKAWIDCNDMSVEGRWDCKEGGVEVSYRNWDRNQPQGGSLENCAAISKINSSLKAWHDYVCTLHFHTVCKQPVE